LTTPGTSLFTNEVADALRRFQLKFHLPPTGTADPQTIRMLNIRAVVEGGC
jgi:murein L,D-transpeptidase YcbB/YkuD